MISKQQVKHIAKLARLSLTEKEIKKFQKELGHTLDYINILKELNVEKIKPTSQVTGLNNVFRDDKAGKSLSQSEALCGTKSQYNGHFKTKRILEHK